MDVSDFGLHTISGGRGSGVLCGRRAAIALSPMGDARRAKRLSPKELHGLRDSPGTLSYRTAGAGFRFCAAGLPHGLLRTRHISRLLEVRQGSALFSPAAPADVGRRASMSQQMASPSGANTMWQDFKAFLIKQNMLALAIAVVLGAATNDVIQALVNDFIMPVINALIPGGSWEQATFGAGRVQFTYGHFLSVLLKFVIVGIVCWRIMRMFMRPPKADEKPATRECPHCRQSIDARATRCAFCTSDLRAAA
jgi:large conductance mechanosensitive channel